MPVRKQNRFLVAAGLGLVVAVALSISGAASYVSARSWVDHTLEVRENADAWMNALLDAQTSARGYVVSGKAIFLDSYTAALPRERAQAARARDLVRDNPLQGASVAQADREALLITTQLAELVARVRAGDRNAAAARVVAGEGEELMGAFRGDMVRIHAEEERLLVERRERLRNRAVWTLGGGFLLMVASVASLWFAWNEQRRRVAMVGANANEARRRLEALSRAASALATVRSRADVAKVVVDVGMATARADTCTLYMLDETGKVLELLGERGVAKEVIDRIRRITADSGNPVSFATLETGQAIWAENEKEYLAIFPRLATTKTESPRARAFWSMPLVVEGRPVGLLGMGFYQPREFSTEERAFIETLARQCGQALARARYLEREDEARQWFATTLRSVGDAVIATDPDGRVSFMNPAAENLAGWTEEEARGRPLVEVFDIFSERSRQPAENPVAKVLREGKVVGLANHTVLRSRRGVETPIDDSAAPIRDESGRLFGVVMVFRDVSREKREQARGEFLARAGEALASSLDHRATLATVAGFAVPELADWCAVDLVEPEKRGPQQVAVAHVDPAKVALARAFGERYPPDPEAGTGVPEVIRTGRSQLYPAITAEMLERGARDDEHLRMIRELHLHSAMVVPLRAHGSVLGAMTFIQAESERTYTEADLAFAEDFARRAAMAIENAVAMKEAQEARAREHLLRDAAEVANRAKDEFLATVSHELRTPLNSILGWTQILRRKKPPEELDRPLSIIERSTRAQVKLIEDILDVSRIISGKLVLNVGPTNVGDVVAAAAETVTPAADAKGIRISMALEDPSMIVTADADRLQQIVWNLLTNAVKFTPVGGHVSVATKREGTSMVISVIDDGEGIRSEALAAIFEPFRQVDASTTRRHGGLGLGLAIVKQLVVAHGGTVEATSEGQGKGTAFVVRIPVRPTTTALRPSSSSPPVAAELPRLDGLRVLVIDDEEDALQLVSAVLEGQGAEVRSVASAAEALGAIADLRPDVVVSDIGMPDVDGYSLIRQVRALPPARGGHTPAVALTAYAGEGDAQRAFEAGFQMHVTKPIEPAQLAMVVAKLGGRRHDEPS